MYFFITVALAALPLLVGAAPAQKPRHNTLSVSLSKRSTPRGANGAVAVRNLQAGTHHTTAKFRRGFEVFERNTGKRHPLAKHRHLDKRSAPGIVSLTDFHSFMWCGTIQAGTPSKEFSVDFDTGSAEMFLSGPSCQSCQGHNIYNPSHSSTAKDLGLPANLTYGIGNIVGNLFTDTINVGGFKASNETLIVTSNITTNFNVTNFGGDGILGMGFSSLSPFNTSTVFETLVKEGQLPEPVFGIALADSNPELIIGGRDSSRYKGDLVYTPVDTGTVAFWQTKLDSIAINGNDIQVSTKEAVIDTGTSLILGDQTSIANIYAGIPGSAKVNSSDIGNGEFWTFPCNTTVNASVGFGGTTFAISPEIFNLGPLSTGSSSCVGCFGNHVAGDTFWIIGDAFLRNVYTEFDYGNLRLGFAPLA